MEIVNIVAIAKMREPFDLDLLLNKLDHTERAPVWLKMRLKPENYYIAFYGSGKFLITGIKDIKMVENISKRVIKLLHNAKINNTLENIKIKNIVMTDEVNLKKSLNDIIVSLNSSSASYEPEQFPGLFYKDSAGITYTLFSSGKITMTGFIDQELAKKNIKKFKKLLI
ncbi:hypothetical protein [Methanobacterium spitsbergense]|uniref:TATA-box-binding protein n=1 Tax=Methanobacterium spitsbergense TaxID=2874285 RepID=A0A8T5UTE7_9EURY|nr:hypothetical protein [Methanobacterium spitsbergense]MBZ2164490.1 hypothetical protein [Methanobacterium spitsbergense]